MRDSGNQLQSTREIPGDSRTAIITRLAENIPGCCTESCDIGTFDPHQLETIGLAANPHKARFRGILSITRILETRPLGTTWGGWKIHTRS
jgi:hypothetical protein